MTLEQMFHWIAIGGSLIGSLATAGMIVLYKWKLDRLWNDYAWRHRINGHAEEDKDGQHNTD